MFTFTQRKQQTHTKTWFPKWCSLTKKKKDQKKGEPQKPVNSEEVCEGEVYTVRDEQKHHISEGIWSLTGMGQGKSFILALQEYFYSKHNPFEQIQTYFRTFIQSRIVRIPQKSSFVFRHHAYLKSMSHTFFRQFTSLQWTSFFLLLFFSLIFFLQYVSFSSVFLLMLFP